MMFSATQTEKTKALTSLALKKEPVYVGVDDTKELATVSGLEQGYVVCPSEKRLLILFTFLKKNRKKKVMVFFSSCMSVKYHHELFNYIDLPVMCIHVSTCYNIAFTTTYCIHHHFLFPLSVTYFVLFLLLISLSPNFIHSFPHSLLFSPYILDFVILLNSSFKSFIWFFYYIHLLCLFLLEGRSRSCSLLCLC